MTLKTLLLRLTRVVLVLMVLAGIALIVQTGDVQQSLISVASVTAMFFFCMIPMIAVIYFPLKNMNKKYREDDSLN